MSAQLLDEPAQRQVGAAPGALPRDAQRQRQPRAQPGQLHELRRVVGRAVVVGDAVQQLHGLRLGEHVQHEAVRAVAGHQAGEPAATGDHDQAARRARQQRADLRDVGGVVEQHEHAAAREHRAVGGGPALQVGGHRLAGVAQGPQEVVERVRGRDRRAGVVAAQVDVELAVREGGGHPVRPVHGERGLADPGGAGDHAQADAGHVRTEVVVQEAVEALELLVAVHVAAHVSGELAGRRPGGAGARAVEVHAPVDRARLHDVVGGAAELVAREVARFAGHGASGSSGATRRAW
ncbi:hypothetical protein [Actinosynnema sp.]|uniref:hypothetical protein n=1 Tax=Actinosynnema sp. TaxID=1872144 RepID=UPI003F854247